MSYKLDLRKSVASCFGRLSTKQILEVFKDKPITARTIYNVLRDCREGKEQENKKKSGRPPSLGNRAVQNLLKGAKNKIGSSQRKLSRKYGVSQRTVGRILKKNNLQVRKRKTAPKYTAKQLENIPKCCRALRVKHSIRDKFIIMDDEKYFTFSNSSMLGNDSFYTDNYEMAPDNVKYAGKTKFEPKVLMWIAISSKGISVPYFQSSSSVSVNTDIYIANCLPKLKRFIEEKHANDKIIFWPDLASCHYANKTQNWLRKQKIDFVPKNDNPPNVPQARPIERFWAILSRGVYENGWEAQNHQQLIRRIKRKLKEIDVSVVQNMILGVPKILRKIEDNGPLAAM